jgi:hypothetical protein
MLTGLAFESFISVGIIWGQKLNYKVKLKDEKRLFMA